jgi:hypothetical protein
LTREDDDDDDDVAAHVIARDITSMVTARTSRVAMRRARHRDRPILGASPISRDFAGRDSRARRLENIAGVSPVEKKRRDATADRRSAVRSVGAPVDDDDDDRWRARGVGEPTTRRDDATTRRPRGGRGDSCDHGVETGDGEAHQAMLRRERTERGRGGAENAEENGEE